MAYQLPQLPYAYDALEPFIDARTMEIHHTKHHQTYVDKLNAVLDKYPSIAEQPLEHLLGSLDQLDVPPADKAAIRNHGGGHSNHTFFWQIMGPAKAIDQDLVSAITDAFGSLKVFKQKFTDLSTGIFGSGWAWLARDQAGKLQLYPLPNQDSPLLQGHEPVIGLDVWEHAYYLKYQNKRADYIAQWWNVVKFLP